jgi:membrane protein
VTLGPTLALLREVVAQWQRDRALAQGAALAYYTLFSMAPLLVLVIALAGLALGRAAAEGELVDRIAGLVGPDGARLVAGMIGQVSQPRSGALATAASLLTMVFGATGVFAQLQTSLNDIFRAAPPARTRMHGFVRQRLAAFAMILGVGALLFVSLVLSAAVAAVRGFVTAHLPLVGRLLPLLDVALSLAVVTTLFALVYKVLPDVRLRWRDVWLGAAVTAVLFTVGKTLIALYLGRVVRTSVYGAAGSLVLLLLWVYYSSQILFLGAEFTEVYSRRYGSRRGAQRVAVARVGPS